MAAALADRARTGQGRKIGAGFRERPLLKPQYQYQSRRSPFKQEELISDGPEKIIDIPNVMNRGLGYYSSHVEPDLNDEPHIYKDQFSQDRATIEGYTAQLVGGGTNLYGGVSFRFTPLDFKLKSFNAGRQLPADPQGDVEREARDWPIQYEDLEPYYCKTEKLVGLNGTAQNQLKPFSEDCYQKPLAPNPISRYAKTGMEILARQINQANPALPYRTPLAVITEDHAPSGRTVPTNPQTEKPATSIATAIRWGASRVPGCRCSARCKTCQISLSIPIAW